MQQNCHVVLQRKLSDSVRSIFIKYGERKINDKLFNPESQIFFAYTLFLSRVSAGNGFLLKYTEDRELYVALVPEIQRLLDAMLLMQFPECTVESIYIGVFIFYKRKRNENTSEVKWENM